MNLLIRWALVALALWITVALLPGLHLATPGVWPLLVAALVVGLVNAIVRPIMVVLTLPITVLTLGLFLLVVNALALLLAAAISPLVIDGFWWAMLGAIVLSIVSTVIDRLFRDRR